MQKIFYELSLVGRDQNQDPSEGEAMALGVKRIERKPVVINQPKTAQTHTPIARCSRKNGLDVTDLQ